MREKGGELCLVRRKIQSRTFLGPKDSPVHEMRKGESDGESNCMRQEAGYRDAKYNALTPR